MWNKEILVPTVEESRQFTPRTFDFELARSQGLIGQHDTLTDTYLKAQAIYTAAFYVYLDKMVNISQYEKILDESGFTFVPFQEPSIYQRYASFGNRFIFLRNHFHIERLNSDDLKILLEASDEDALVELAARTYKDVIRMRRPGDTGTRSIIYDVGALSGALRAPDGALLLYLVHEWELIENDEFDLPKEKEKAEFAGDLAIRMQEEMAEILGVFVVVYSMAL